MQRKIVYLNESISEKAETLLRSKYDVVNNYDNIENINAIITRKEVVNRDIMCRAKNLKIVSDHGTGTDQIDLVAAKELGIKVTNTPGLNAQSVAELAVGFFIALNYKIKKCHTGMEAGTFEKFGLPELNGNEISGKKLGIIGSGYIAKKLSLIMRTAFSAEIYCYNPHKTKEELLEIGFKKIETLEEFFSKMDFISIHAPLTSETKNLVNEKILSCANPNLILVNTSRGGIVNEKDLYNALVSKKIKGAALDVFEMEPPSKENPLLHLENFLGTLHVGGSTQEALDRVGLATVQNIIDVLG